MSEQVETQQQSEAPVIGLPASADVPEELRGEYKRMLSIIRGNNRHEQDLATRGRMMDPIMVLSLKLNLLLDQTMGEVTATPQRLAFEIKFAEAYRTILGQAVLAP